MTATKKIINNKKSKRMTKKTAINTIKYKKISLKKQLGGNDNRRKTFNEYISGLDITYEESDNDLEKRASKSSKKCLEFVKEIIVTDLDNNFINIEDAKIESTILNNPFSFETKYLLSETTNSDKKYKLIDNQYLTIDKSELLTNIDSLQKEINANPRNSKKEYNNIVKKYNKHNVFFTDIRQSSDKLLKSSKVLIKLFINQQIIDVYFNFDYKGKLFDWILHLNSIEFQNQYKIDLNRTVHYDIKTKTTIPLKDIYTSSRNNGEVDETDMFNALCNFYKCSDKFRSELLDSNSKLQIAFKLLIDQSIFTQFITILQNGIFSYDAIVSPNQTFMYIKNDKIYRFCMLKINKFDDKTNNFDDNSPYNLGYFYFEYYHFEPDESKRFKIRIVLNDKFRELTNEKLKEYFKPIFLKI